MAKGQGRDDIIALNVGGRSMLTARCVDFDGAGGHALKAVLHMLHGVAWRCFVLLPVLLPVLPIKALRSPSEHHQSTILCSQQR
jgi:hypothetical protein